jgi:hypothetical protein
MPDALGSPEHSLGITNIHVVKAGSSPVMNFHLGGVGTSEVTSECPPGCHLFKHRLLHASDSGAALLNYLSN